MSPALTVPPRAPGRATATRDRETVLRELSAVIFSSLPRSDQRRTGEEYLHALLCAEGRKSFRKLAALSGARANAQRLHHFISVSTWDWSAVRRDLASYLARELPVRAWVVRPLARVKGLDTARLAFGVWAACPAAAWPVGWRLHAPGTETTEDCLIRCAREMSMREELPLRPIIVDARGVDVTRLIRELRSVGAAMLVHIPTAFELVPAMPLQPGSGRIGALPARRILEIADSRRREIAAPPAGSEVIGSLPVRLPAASAMGTCGGEFALLGAGARGPRWPDEMWISDLTTTPPADLYRLARLMRRVDKDFTRFGDAAGLRDFAGRTAEGWYRHVTLASAACAVLALSELEG